MLESAAEVTQKCLWHDALFEAAARGCALPQGLAEEERELVKGSQPHPDGP